MNIHGLKLKHKKKIRTIEQLEKSIEEEKKKPKWEIDRYEIRRLENMINQIEKSKNTLSKEIKELKKKKEDG